MIDEYWLLPDSGACLQHVQRTLQPSLQGIEHFMSLLFGDDERRAQCERIPEYRTRYESFFLAHL
jgi:hypothetical protein